VYNASATELLTGNIDGSIYHWDISKHEVVKAIANVHEGGVFALEFTEDAKLISAGKDGRVLLHDGPNPKVLMNTAGHAIRSLSVVKKSIAAACEDSSIFYIKDFTASQPTPVKIAQGHSTLKDAEIWGVAAHPSKLECMSVSEDSRVFLWDLNSKKEIVSKTLDAPLGACCYHPKGINVAVSGMGPQLYILKTEDLSIIKEIKVEALKHDTHKVVKYSPDGKYLAVAGLHNESGVDIFDVEEWTRVYTCKGHSSLVIALDWSSDSKYLQTNSLDHELLFWEMPKGKQITAASELRDVAWNTLTLTTAWPTLGIWGDGMKGADINSVARDPKQSLLVSGDDFSRVNLFSYPADQENTPSKSYQGHASHVTHVEFTHDAAYVVSTGGLDGCVVQWKAV